MKRYVRSNVNNFKHIFISIFIIEIAIVVDNDITKLLNKLRKRLY